MKQRIKQSARVNNAKGKKAQLRPYQQEIVKCLKDKLVQNFCGRYLVQLPTGMGKTVTFSELLAQLGKKALVIAHREELLFQARNKILAQVDCRLFEIDIIQQSSPNSDAKIWIASIQSLARGDRLAKVSPEIIIIDEAHHSIASTYQTVINAFPTLPIIGFTATPTRNRPSEKAELARLWDEIVYQYPLKKAIRDKWIAGIVYYKVKTDISLEGIKTVAGDFARGELEERVNVELRNQACLEKYMELGGGKAVVYCAGVAHSQNICMIFQKKRIKCYHIDATTPLEERRKILSKFLKAKHSDNIVLTNCEVLTEGWDCPDIRQLILARPTKSQILYLQMIGRGMRRVEGIKDKIILVDIADHYKKGLQHCLNAVFNLDANVELQGDILEEVDERRKELLSPAGQVLLEEEEQEKVVLAIANILFEIPLELQQSALNWVAPNDNEYICQIAKGSYLRIEDGILKYKLFKDNEMLLESSDINEIIQVSMKEAHVNSDFQFLWSKERRKFMEDKQASEKQIALLEQLAPQVNAVALSRETASQMITAILVKQPATGRQRWKLRQLGYTGDMQNLTKPQASKLIGSLLQERVVTSRSPNDYD